MSDRGKYSGKKVEVSYDGKTLLRMPVVQKKTSLSRSSIYELMAAGTFPKPVKIGPRAVAWVEVEIDAWMQDRIEARDAKAA
jgi:prophage regulatory protein